ncbi:MAG: hypothetical protein M3282_06520, partial [Gemmatimonadota bacterium]|nr:hypothetical protein [Gemmatimonadota bacterium]
DEHLGFLRDACGCCRAPSELTEHHRGRLDDTAAALSTDERTAFEISVALFGEALSPTQRRFAVGETLSHLERLVRDGRAARGGDGVTVTYTEM